MSTVLCPGCGSVNNGGALACQRCGVSLTAGSLPPGYGYAPQGYGWAPTGYPGAVPARGNGLGKGVIILVIAGVVIFGAVAVGIVAAIAIPSLLAARKAANEASAIGTLRTIGSAEATYYAQYGMYGSLADLASEQLLDDHMADGFVRDGYRFSQVTTADLADGFEFNAEPVQEAGGARAFTVTEDFVIRYAKGRAAPPGRRGLPIEGGH
jgi:type IV pilus assembly protein PilA